MLDGLVECPLTMIAGKLYTRRKRIRNRGVRSSNKRGVMMRSRSNNSSKRGACKGGVDEGRSRSSCSGKSRKRDAHERGRVAGMGGKATAGGRGDVESDPQVQNVEGGKGWHLQPLEC